MSFLSPPLQTTLTASVHVGDGSPAQTERHIYRDRKSRNERAGVSEGPGRVSQSFGKGPVGLAEITWHRLSGLHGLAAMAAMGCAI